MDEKDIYKISCETYEDHYQNVMDTPEPDAYCMDLMPKTVHQQRVTENHTSSVQMKLKKKKPSFGPFKYKHVLSTTTFMILQVNVYLTILVFLRKCFIIRI